MIRMKEMSESDIVELRSMFDGDIRNLKTIRLDDGCCSENRIVPAQPETRKRLVCEYCGCISGKEYGTCEHCGAVLKEG